MDSSIENSVIDALRRSATAWRCLPVRGHLLAVLLLASVALMRFPFPRTPAARGDEVVYLQAFEASRSGGTPYDVEGYFYPRAFARAGGRLLAAAGETGTLAVLRTVNLLGLAFAFWAATAWLPAKVPRRWLAAAVLLCLSPAVHAGLDLGNVSFLIVGLTLAALLGWPRRPLLAGVLLGLGVALKPIAAAVIPVLLLHRPRHGGRRHLLAAATAAAVATALLLPLSDLREMLGQEMVALANARSFSLSRLFALFGLDVPQVVLTLAVIALAALGALWRHPGWGPTMSSARLLAYAVAAVSLATPLVWNHTLIVALPVQGLALALAWHRLCRARSATGAGRPIPAWRRFEPLLVVLGVAMMHAGTTAGFDHLSPWIQALLLLAIGLTPALVCAYVFRFTARLELPAASDRPPPPGR